jgi:hypothetical protein
MELLTNEQLLEEGGKALQKIRGGIRFSFNQVQQFQQQLRQATPQPINRALDTIAEGVEYVAEKTPFGVAERGATATGEMVGEATGSKALGQAVGFGLGLAVPGPEISQAAKPVIPKGIKPKVPVQPTTLPPMGPSPAMALAGSGGSVKLSNQLDPNTVFKLTLKDPENIPKGITKGSAKSAEWVPQMQDFYMRRAAIKEKLQSAASAKQKAKYQEEAYNTVSTGMSRNPAADPEAYGSAKRFEQFKEQSEITPLTSTGNIKWQQQHHLFSKQESYQFVERMIELGDDDDVLALFIMAEDMDAVLGGRLSNMLNMEDLPHSVLHGSRRVDKRELQSAAMRNLVENAKSTDELMRMFRQYVTENVLPSKEEAKALKIIGKRLMAADKYEYLNEIRDKMYR